MGDGQTVHPETRMLIDGKLVDAQSGQTFANVNPNTEEVLGQVADATVADMQRAIAAARSAFDETDWSTNHSFRKQCLEQLQEALEAEQEERREQLILEVGCPRMLTHGPQLSSSGPTPPTGPARRWRGRDLSPATALRPSTTNGWAIKGPNCMLDDRVTQSGDGRGNEARRAREIRGWLDQCCWN